MSDSKPAGQKPVLTAILLVCTLLLLALRVLTMDRGIYFLDESYYPFTYADPQYHTITVTGAAHMVHRLFGWMNPGILDYRWLHLLFDVLGGLVFFAGFYPWYRKTLPVKESVFFAGPVPVLLVILSASMVTGFVYPQSISYYSLNNFMLLCFAGGLLAFLSSETDKHSVWALAAAGFFAGLVFVVRLPSAVCLVFLSLLLVVWQSFGTRALLFKQLGVYGLSALVALGIYFALVQSPAHYQAQFLPLLDILRQGSHPAGELLKSYVIALLTLVNVFVEYHGWIILLMIWAFRSEKFSRGLLWIFPLVVLGIAVWDKFHQPELTSIKIFWLLLVCLFAWRVSKQWQSSGDASLLGGVALLFLLPWIFAVGTNLDILTIMYGCILPWIALFVFGLERLCEKALQQIMLGLLLVFMVLHGWFGLVQAPVTISSQTLLQQTETITDLPALDGIKVSAEAKRYLREIKQTLDQHGYQPGQTILSYHRVPGLVYLMGARAFGGGYYLDGEEFNRENCYYLLQTGHRKEPPAFILAMKEPSAAFQKCLLEAGVNVTADYEQVGTIETPAGFYYQAPDSRPLRILKRRKS